MKFKLALAALPVLFGCATQQALLTDTPSGHPETTFDGATLPEVQNKMIGLCSRIGAGVTETNSNIVVCTKTVQGQQAVMAQLLLGNSYSTTPVDRLRFILDASGSSVHVTAYESIETVMPFGQVHSADLTSNSARNGLQSALDRLDGSEYQRTLEKARKPKNTPYVLDPKDSIVGTGKVGESFTVKKFCTTHELSKNGLTGATGPKVKSYEPGQTMTIYERDGMFARVSPDGAPQEWIMYGICS
ncbi:hypothetical protein [Paraburkholderia sp. SIMBA_027]|uniref:hypothetical protein n=1 Tax=Paraburkholderia sp. SIMBA_027 TaxID=3085770 RepID=UPI00397D7BDB